MAAEIESNFLLTFFLIFFGLIIVFLVAYIYQAIALYNIAKKTKTKNEWLAWIPIGNLVLMADIAQMHWWPVLLYVPAIMFIFISTIFRLFSNTLFEIIFLILYYITIIIPSIFVLIWTWKIYERVSRPGYWAIIPLIITSVGVIILFFGLIIQIKILFWIGATIIVAGIVQQYAYMGIAAWHKNSTYNNSLRKNN